MPASGGIRQPAFIACKADCIGCDVAAVNQGEKHDRQQETRGACRPPSRQRNAGETFYNVTFERRYRDDANKWQSSSSFGMSDLLLLAKVADLAHSEIHRLRAAHKEPESLVA